MAVMLSIQNVSFAYESTRKDVLRDVSLVLEAGTCMFLMGVNGCGKSTLLDCILREHTPQQGTISIDSHPVVALQPRELARMASYVPQIHERTFPFDVRHVVLMGRTAHMGSMGQGTPEDEACVDAALAACGIEHLATRESTTLSGGEMQMVLLARALAQDAPLVLMDEPTAHLDFRNELLFLEAVARLVRNEGRTVLMATHAPNQAFHLAAEGVDVQVAVMHKGRVLKVGTPEDVLVPSVLQEAFGVQAAIWTQDGMHQVVPMKTGRNA